MAVPLIIEVQLDDTAIKSGVDKLQALGQIDSKQAGVLKQTNAVLSDRNTILQQTAAATDKITQAITPQQAAYNKLKASLVDLFGTSKATATELLKLSSDQLFQGLKNQGTTIDQFILKLRAMQVGTVDLPVNFAAVTESVKAFTDAVNAVDPSKLSNLSLTDSSPIIFQKTNDELRQRNVLLKETIVNTDKLTVSLTPQQVTFNKLAASLKNLSGQSKDTVTQLLKLSPEQLAQGFKNASINVDDFINSLEKVSTSSDETTESTVKLRTELLTINDAMAKLSLAGEEGSTAFTDLTLRSKVLTKALADQREFTKNLASDTPALSALQSGVEGLTGAFEVGIGLTGLFGEKNKDLEEVLIRVNSIMVFAQGAQQVFNTLKKESALNTFIAIAAMKAENAQRQIDIALTSESTAVRTGAIAAQKALNFAMAANPIGLFVVGLATLITALGIYFNAAEKARREEEAFNEAVRTSNLLAEHNAALQRNSDEFIANLQKKNAKESEITKEQARSQREIVENNQKDIDARQKVVDDNRLRKQVEANKAVAAATAGSITTAVDFIPEVSKKEQEFIDKIKADVIANDKLRDNLRLADIKDEKVTSDELLQITRDRATAELQLKIQGSRAFFAAERVENNAQLQVALKDAGDNEGKIALAKSNFAKKLRDIDAQEKVQAAENELNLETANLLKIQTETRRINTQISREETEAQIQAINTRSAAEIAALQKQVELDESFRAVANARITVIEAQRIQQTEQLRRDQLIREITLLNQNEIARRNVQLAGIQVTNKKRLELEIANVDSQTKIDLAGTALTEEGKLAIVEQANEKKRQLTNASIQQIADDEIALNRGVADRNISELKRQLAAQTAIRAAGLKGNAVAVELNVPKLNLDQQKQAIQDITDFELAQNKIAIKANDDKIQSEEDFTKADAVLVAQRVKIRKDGELAIQDANAATVDFNKSTNEQIIQASFQAAQQVLGFIDSVFQAQEQADQARLDSRRKQVQDELDAGEITAKAAQVRNKELDQQQKQLQREQAKRQKEMALFNAIIQTASAVATALTAGPIAGIIAAAAAAAIGAAEIAIIAATPIPSFYKGKNLDKKGRDQYEGWAEAGERGAELWQSGSKTKLIEKSTIIWVKKGDIIYNAAQTAAMMKDPQATITQGPVFMSNRIPTIVINTPALNLDYKKLAAAVKNSTVNLSIDGYKDFIQTEKDFTTVLNNRRKWQ